MTLAWHFPLLGGGDIAGIHNAGIETFRPFSKSLVREMGQNTLDAPDGSGSPVFLVFKRENIERNDIPGLKDIRDRLIMCRKFWDHPDPNKRDQDAVDFLDNALRLIQKETISCLRISDYNTTGVPGDDGDRSSGWHKLAKSSGTTGKAATSGAGGSFGMGKLAAIGASQFRTVYYSTLTAEGDHRFIGSSLLTTHADSAGTEYQHKWYYGYPGGGTVMKKGDIPPIFLRKTVGLDTVVTSFDFSENWEEEIAASILNNFWPAIMWGRMECIVGDGKKEIIIDQPTLPDLLARFAPPLGVQPKSHETEAQVYYKAYTNGLKHEASQKRLKECSAYAISGEGLPKKFAMIRRNGMIIEERTFSSRLPIAGVFECVNETGNSLLRSMEPPCHDRWDPDLFPPEGAKIEAEFKRVIYDSIKKVNSVSGAETGSVTGLEELLPFDEQIINNSNESNRPTRRLAENPKQTSSTARIPRKTLLKKRKKNPGGHTIISIIPRAIKTGSGQYVLKIEHEGKADNAYISLGIAGDRTSNKVKITSAQDSSGNTITVNENTFGPVSLDNNNSFNIKLAVKRRIALEVCAYHEA